MEAAIQRVIDRVTTREVRSTFQLASFPDNDVPQAFDLDFHSLLGDGGHGACLAFGVDPNDFRTQKRMLQLTDPAIQCDGSTVECWQSGADVDRRSLMAFLLSGEGEEYDNSSGYDLTGILCEDGDPIRMVKIIREYGLEAPIRLFTYVGFAIAGIGRGCQVLGALVPDPAGGVIAGLDLVRSREGLRTTFFPHFTSAQRESAQRFANHYGVHVCGIEDGAAYVMWDNDRRQANTMAYCSPHSHLHWFAPAEYRPAGPSDRRHYRVMRTLVDGRTKSTSIEDLVTPDSPMPNRQPEDIDDANTP